MTFSRKPSFTFTKEEIEELKRPLTLEEEKKLDDTIEKFWNTQNDTKPLTTIEIVESGKYHPSLDTMWEYWRLKGMLPDEK